MRDVIGGYPCDIDKKAEKITIIFHHGKNNSKVQHGKAVKLRLELDAEGIKNLKKILS